ncbi:MAG: ATP-dependent helicase [Acetatifactor sp.]|nr:ATP-dependent helicase [Acetatifactor sp.]
MTEERKTLIAKLGLEHANQAQLNAILYENEGPLLVLAGPGSGKTFVLTQRIRYLTEIQKVQPEKILVLTFTRDAASSMKERYFAQPSVKHENVSQTVKQNNVSRSVNFGTFHSIFYHVLKQSTNLQDRNMMTDTDKKRILLPGLKKACPEMHYVEQNNVLPELIGAISYYKNSGRLEGAINKLNQAIKEQFGDLFQFYERERMRMGKIDFDDMLTDCHRLLSERTELRKAWQDRFDHILIDEFQDINPAQYEVIKLLTKEPYNLFGVGDDDQSIYGFRGADPGCMKRFEMDFHARKVVLNVNYRSKAEIVQASQNLISHNHNRFDKKIMSYEEDYGLQRSSLEKTLFPKGRIYALFGKDKLRIPGIDLRDFLNKDEETQYVISKCKEFIQLESDEHMAILFRTNRLMQRIAMRMAQEKIGFTMREKLTDPIDSEVGRDVLGYLCLAKKKATNTEFIRVINKPSRYISRESLTQCLESGRANGVEPSDLIGQMVNFYQGRDTRMVERMQKLRQQLSALEKLSPYTAVQYIRRMIGYEAYLNEAYRSFPEKKDECIDQLEWLSEEAKAWSDLDEFINYLEGDNKRKEHQGISNPVATDKTPQKITLLTIHAAKGLEFDRVMIPNCNERIFPHGSLLPTEVLEEERRIFYVGLTRAKTSLELTYVSGRRDHPEEPSRFLQEMTGVKP